MPSIGSSGGSGYGGRARREAAAGRRPDAGEELVGRSRPAGRGGGSRREVAAGQMRGRCSLGGHGWPSAGEELAGGRGPPDAGEGLVRAAGHGGGARSDDYLLDPIAISAFYTVQKGVTVVCSASNSSPQPGSVTKVLHGSLRSARAPWLMSPSAASRAA
uniref:Uncharacterized protein n=1 Tax=Oryza rufipogon TaxID=4529 RepID=A0A0E0NU92_ORYRU